MWKWYQSGYAAQALTIQGLRNVIWKWHQKAPAVQALMQGHISAVSVHSCIQFIKGDLLKGLEGQLRSFARTIQNSVNLRGFAVWSMLAPVSFLALCIAVNGAADIPIHGRRYAFAPSGVPRLPMVETGWFSPKTAPHREIF